MAAKLDRERMARVLAEASATSDAETAEKYGVTERTVWNYRKRLSTDPELAKAYGRLLAAEVRGWQEARVRSLQAAAKRAAELIAQETDLDKISKYIEKTGGVDMVGAALGVSDVPAGRSAAPEEDPGGEEGDPSEERAIQ